MPNTTLSLPVWSYHAARITEELYQYVQHNPAARIAGTYPEFLTRETIVTLRDQPDTTLTVHGTSWCGSSMSWVEENSSGERTVYYVTFDDNPCMDHSYTRQPLVQGCSNNTCCILPLETLLRDDFYSPGEHAAETVQAIIDYLHSVPCVKPLQGSIMQRIHIVKKEGDK